MKMMYKANVAPIEFMLASDNMPGVAIVVVAVVVVDMFCPSSATGARAVSNVVSCVAKKFVIATIDVFCSASAMGDVATSEVVVFAAGPSRATTKGVATEVAAVAIEVVVVVGTGAVTEVVSEVATAVAATEVVAIDVVVDVIVAVVTEVLVVIVADVATEVVTAAEPSRATTKGVATHIFRMEPPLPHIARKVADESSTAVQL